MKRQNSEDPIIEFSWKNGDKFIDLINSLAEAEKMSFESTFHVVLVNKYLFIDNFLYFFHHFFLISFFEIGVIFVVDSNWIHSATNSQCFGVEIVLEKLDVHWSWGDNDLEIISFWKKSFYQAENYINADSSFVSLVYHQTWVFWQSGVLGQFI